MQEAIIEQKDASLARTASSWNSPPLDPFPEAAELLGPERLGQLVWAFIALGVVVRLIRYLLHFPLWVNDDLKCIDYAVLYEFVPND